MATAMTYTREVSPEENFKKVFKEAKDNNASVWIDSKYHQAFVSDKEYIGFERVIPR